LAHLRKTMTAATQPKQKRWIKHVIGAAVTLVCLLAIARLVNFSEVMDALEHFRWHYLVLGIASLAFGYAVRIFRWSVMLSAASHAVGFRNCAAPFLGAIALNNVLPLRLGDVIRALVFPGAMGVTKTVATTSLVVERLIDLVTLIACLALGILAVSTLDIPPAIKQTAVILAALGGIALALGFFFSGTFARLFTKLGIDQPTSKIPPKLQTVFRTVGGQATRSGPHVAALDAGLAGGIRPVLFCIAGVGSGCQPAHGLVGHGDCDAVDAGAVIPGLCRSVPPGSLYRRDPYWRNHCASGQLRSDRPSCALAADNHRRRLGNMVPSCPVQSSH
jgi:hypothetical protein